MQSTRHSASRPLVRTLVDRSATGRSRGVELWAEDESVFRQQLEYLDLSGGEPTRSTIAISFSADGKLFASTHGDHTVKITSYLRGKVVQTLRGHPRTPWTVKFHPKDSRIVASGCIGSEVKVWNASTGQCLHTATLEAAIISLSFHPSGRMLAMASSVYIYLWDYNNGARPFIAWAHSHALRCVRFTPGGNGIIVGAANSGSSVPSHQSQTQTQVSRTQNQNERTGAARSGAGGGAGAETSAPAPPQPAGTAAARSGGGGLAGAALPAEVTFRLQVWDFSLEAALEENIAAAMTRERVLLGETLLYNDGGFDVSQDGLWLCAIAGLREKAGGDCPPVSPPSQGSDAVGTLPPSSSTLATTMATVMEAEETGGDGEEPAAVAGARIGGGGGGGGAAGNPGGVCRGAVDGGGRSNSSDLLIAPRNGSHLGGWGQQQTPPVSKITGAAAAAAAAGAAAAGAAAASADATTGAAPGIAAGTPPIAPEGVKESSGGGGEKCVQGVADEREEGVQEERGKAFVLAPWPSRARPRPYFSVAFAGEDLGKRGEAAEKRGGPPAYGASGVAEGFAAEAEAAAAVVAVADRSADASNEPPPFTPPPFTPSPRISLKRRLSGSWLSAVSGGRGGGRGGAGSSGGFWGRELRRGGSPRLGNSEKGGGEDSSQRREDHPPPLPPPLPPGGLASDPLLSAASPPVSTASPPSFVAYSRQPPQPRLSPPLPPATGDAVAGSSPAPSSVSSSRGLRISLPLLLPPPPRPSAGGLGVGASAIGVAAGELEQSERRRGQQHQGGNFTPPLPSQPDFFLRVPANGATSAASVALGGPEGRAWDARYLGAGSAGEQEAQEAPLSYGRRATAAGNSSTGEAEHSHGGGVPGGRQERNPEDATDRGRRELRRNNHQRGRGGSQEVDSTSWESSGGGGDSGGGGGGGGGGPSSFGRAHRRVLPLALLPAGKLVPHLVLVSLNLEDGKGAGEGRGEKAARVVRAEAMDIFTAKQVTSVKLSPSARYILLGLGVRGDGGGAIGGRVLQQADNLGQGAAAGPSAPSEHQHSLSSIYRSANLQPVNSMPTAEEDVNIACFHPEPGMGCVYGTKQGRVGLVRMSHAD